VRIVAVSDTHSMHRAVAIPDGDVLIHAGDATRGGEVGTILDLACWMEALPHKTKIFVPGNHDFCFDIGHHKFRPEARGIVESRGICLLMDSVIEVEGLRVFGSPWVPHLWNWAFFDRGRDLFERAPTDIDILVTHGPPAGVRDAALRDPDDPSKGYESVGNIHLLRYTQRCPRLRLHVFGHVHEGYGIATRARTTSVNAASCTRHYKPTQPAMVIDLAIASGTDAIVVAAPSTGAVLH
jgi:calcineurin-like phosphoesterase family protein